MAGADHADILGGSLGKVEHATTDEGSAIIDPHDNALAVIAVRDLHLGSEPKGLVGGCHVRRIHALAGSSLGVQRIP